MLGRVAALVAVAALVVAVATGSLVALAAPHLVAVGVGMAAFIGLAGIAWLGLVAPRIRQAEERSLRLVGPRRDADVRTEARLLNLVEGLAPTAGVPRPRCLVIEDPALNALALGRDPRHGCVLVTTGLLGSLSRMELEAVVGHALMRLRDGDTSAPTLALALTGGGAPLAGAMGEGGPAAADLAAVGLTRYPPGLVAALRRVATDPGGVHGSGGGSGAPAAAAAVLGPLWFAPPGDAVALAERIEALEEL